MKALELAGELSREIRGRVCALEPLAKHTTLRVGGPADIFAEPADCHEVRACLDFADRKGLPAYILGNGSNILVTDAGVRGVVVKMTSLRKLEIEGELVRAGAGVSLPQLVALTVKNSLAGLEYLAGIPASLGGAVAMNAGTPEKSLGDLVHAVWVLKGEEINVLRKGELDFGYRHSRVLQDKLVVLGAELRLGSGNRAELEQKVANRLARRRQTQPLEYPNAGSIFKNPPGDFAGRLIELIGAKGWRCGGAEVAVKHANFIVNRGGASAREILFLIERIREAVWKQSGILLELEIEVWGD
ncbi:MAG: UDP-N-acetylmuramate dehydrogenase [Clostridia bacterium]|nr:UDP-N-acetylmuramate dehydrogenase [Clostridia bacterium]